MQRKLSLGLSRVLIRILFLEDDTLLAESIVDLLEDADFEVIHVPNSQEVLNLTFKERFDMYLFDINVPMIDGITLLKELRECDDDTPAIFLTSHKEKEMLKNGFLCGGDDYITKPFDNDELILRINALIKRHKPNQAKFVGPLQHDEIHKTISYNDKALELSNKEYNLLSLLMTHANSLVPRELILDELWMGEDGGSHGAIRVYINRLKQLLPDMKIENIRGVGYKLVS